jgi:hypothetical protein
LGHRITRFPGFTANFASLTNDNELITGLETWQFRPFDIEPFPVRFGVRR